MTEHLEKMKLRHRARLQPNLPSARARDVTPSKPAAVENKLQENVQRKVQGKEEKSTRGAGFGGFQRGFLSSSKSASASSTKTGGSTGRKVGTTPSNVSQGTSEPDDDVIRPKQQDSKSSGLEFPEVQEAMRTSYPFLQSEGT